jgi:uncharacterized protein YggE
MKRLFISFLMVAATATTLFSQDSFCETIVVEGKSSVKMVPEIISFHINFTLKNQDYSECQELALGKIEKIKSDFRKNDIDQDLVKTLNYSVRELTRRIPETGEQVFVSYQAHIPMLIKTEYSNAEVPKIFELIKDNFKSDVRINFDLSETQIEAMKEKLIELAIEDAISKANLLVENLDYKVGDVTKIQYGEPRKIRNFTRTNYDLITSQQLEAMSSDVRVSPDVLTPAKTEMRTNVMLAWEIVY